MGRLGTPNTQVNDDSNKSHEDRLGTYHKQQPILSQHDRRVHIVRRQRDIPPRDVEWERRPNRLGEPSPPERLHLLLRPARKSPPLLRLRLRARALRIRPCPRMQVEHEGAHERVAGRVATALRDGARGAHRGEVAGASGVEMRNVRAGRAPLVPRDDDGDAVPRRHPILSLRSAGRSAA